MLDSGVSLKGDKDLRVCAEISFPAEISAQPVALVCLAGGNMNRRYFDLRPPAEAGGGDLRPADAPEAAQDISSFSGRVAAPAPAPALRDTVSPAHGSDSFSFTAQMTARGFIVIALDYLGLGESSKPADCYALLPEILTQACVNASAAVLAKLRDGSLSGDIPAMPKLSSLGIGHSMGAMMTVLHQATAQQHAGIALLGFSTRGLPNYLPPKVVAMTREEQRAGLAGFAQKMFQTQYPVIRSSGNGEQVYGSAKAEPKGIGALKQATDCLLPVTAYLSMLPGNVAPEAAQVRVPVLLAHGERDMAGPPAESAAAFTASPDVRVVVLAETGHSHFLFPTRLELFDRLADWAQSVIRFSRQ